MRIGVLSDTHDDERNVKKIVKIFKNENILKVFHLGDFVAPPIVKHFNGLNLLGIFGNNDGYKTGLLKMFSEIKGELPGDFAEIEVDDLKMALYHGEYYEIVDSLARGGKYDVVFYGHWHKARIENIGRTILISPGSAHSFFTKDSSPTFGIFDTNNKRFDILSI